MPIGIDYKAGVSAQLKSAVIFAGLNSYGNTTIHENKVQEIILKICYKKIKKQFVLFQVKKN